MQRGLRAFGITFCALFATAIAPAQTLAGPTFDVASLKAVRATPDLYFANLGTAEHGEVKLSNVTLSDCLRFAFGISDDAQIAGPDWIRDKAVRFDIDAKASPDTPRDQLLLMLQSLLIERLRLSYHRESRMLSYIALTTGKTAPKLRPATEGSDASGNRSSRGAIISNHMTMPTLATLLSRFLRETVIDKTGLSGQYEVRLEWTPDSATGPANDSTAPEHPSIFTAMRQQVGLTLQPRKGPLEIIVVDHAERVPIAN